MGYVPRIGSKKYESKVLLGNAEIYYLGEYDINRKLILFLQQLNFFQILL
jgi:hypothetical protein